MAGKPGWHQTPEAKEKIRQAQLRNWERRRRAEVLLQMQERLLAEAEHGDMGALVTKDGRLVQ